MSSICKATWVRFAGFGGLPSCLQPSISKYNHSFAYSIMDMRKHIKRSQSHSSKILIDCLHGEFAYQHWCTQVSYPWFIGFSYISRYSMIHSSVGVQSSSASPPNPPSCPKSKSPVRLTRLMSFPDSRRWRKPTQKAAHHWWLKKYVLLRNQGLSRVVE